jgi:hypothetical protein
VSTVYTHLLAQWEHCHICQTYKNKTGPPIFFMRHLGNILYSPTGFIAATKQKQHKNRTNIILLYSNIGKLISPSRGYQYSLLKVLLLRFQLHILHKIQYTVPVLLSFAFNNFSIIQFGIKILLALHKKYLRYF